MSYTPQPPNPYRFPPTAPRRRRGRTIAVVLGVLAVIAVAAGATVVVLVAQDDDDAYDEFIAEVEEQRSQTPPPVEPPASEPAPDEPAEPTDAPTDAPTDESADVLERNALYRAGVMRAAGCAAGSQGSLGGTAGVRAYYRSVVPCLDRAWRQTLRGSGVQFRPVGLEVFSGPAVGSCGDGNQYSFYCPDTMTIHMYADEISAPWNQYAGDDFSHGITRLAALHTIAHEYGHHLQQISGIFTAMGPNWYGTEIERRSELQASCLGNAWLSAQRDAYPIDAVYLDPQWESLWRFITAVPNHGSVGNQKRWSDAGFAGADAGSCNTWTAGAGAVG